MCNFKYIETEDDELVIEIGRFIKAVQAVDVRYYKHKTLDPTSSCVTYEEHLERVFAYELYHQWSCILNHSRSKWIINAEIEKNLNEFCSKASTRSKFPDLVLHEDQGTDNQMIVCEIKREIKTKNIKIDIEKLRMLTNPMQNNLLPYRCGILLIVNHTKEEFKNEINIIGDEISDGIDKILCVFATASREDTSVCFESLSNIINRN